MKNRLLAELEQDLLNFQKSRVEEKQPISALEIIRTLDEAAKILGVSRMSLYRYRMMFPDFPSLPAFKISLRGWAERYGIPRKRGPMLSQRGKMAAYLREQGLTFSEIGKRLGISRVSAWNLWRRQHINNPSILLSHTR